MNADSQIQPDSSFAHRAIRFFLSLNWRGSLPPETEAMNPCLNTEVISLVEEFFHRYYSDRKKRVPLLGINPGRFGAGVTGLTFTDPVFLEEVCGISNSLEKKHELSSRFVMQYRYARKAIYVSKYLETIERALSLVRKG